MKPIEGFNQFEKKYRNMFKKSAALKKIKNNGDLIKRDDIIFIKDTKQTIFA